MDHFVQQGLDVTLLGGTAGENKVAQAASFRLGTFDDVGQGEIDQVGGNAAQSVRSGIVGSTG